MTGRKSRQKGQRGERQVRDLLNDYIPWLAARRGGAQSRSGSDSSDVENTPYWIECKLGKNRPNVHAAYEQAASATDGRPILVFTRQDRGEWLVTMNWELFKSLVDKVTFCQGGSHG